MIKRGEVGHTQLATHFCCPYVAFYQQQNRSTRMQGVCYLHVHQPPSVAQKTDEKRLKKKIGGGRGGVAAARGNESESRGHRGVHRAVICSTLTGRGHAQLRENMWEMERHCGWEGNGGQEKWMQKLRQAVKGRRAARNRQTWWVAEPLLWTDLRSDSAARLSWWESRVQNKLHSLFLSPLSSGLIRCAYVRTHMFKKTCCDSGNEV